nr:pescadillo homolog [Leptinotarsa decemlineata]
MGETLPPNLSPFIDKDRDQQYIPPEARALYDESQLEQQHKRDELIEDGKVVEDDGEERDDGNQEKKSHVDPDGESDQEENIESSPRKSKMSVSIGEMYKEVPWEKIDKNGRNTV